MISIEFIQVALVVLASTVCYLGGGVMIGISFIMGKESYKEGRKSECIFFAVMLVLLVITLVLMTLFIILLSSDFNAYI